MHNAEPDVIASQPTRLMTEAPPPHDTTSPQTLMQGMPDAITGDEQDQTQGLGAGGRTLLDATPYQVCKFLVQLTTRQAAAYSTVLLGRRTCTP